MLSARVIAPLPAEVVTPLMPFTVPTVNAAAVPGLFVRLNAFAEEPFITAANVPIALPLPVAGLIATAPDVVILKFAAVKPLVLFSVMPPVPLAKFKVAAGEDTAAEIVIAPLSAVWPMFKTLAVIVFNAAFVKPNVFDELAVPKFMDSVPAVVVGINDTVPLAPAVVLPASTI